MAHALAGLIFLFFYIFTVDVAFSQYPNETRRIPEIKEGQKCVKGQVYKMDCNTCHCGDRSSLICTKMACFNPADLKNLHLRKSETGKKMACTPGKFYKKGCRKCFCTDKKGLKCSLESNCTVVDRPYTNPETIHKYSPADFFKLPALPHQGVECQPGTTYRIDCNTCFCLATGNLMCQKLLCPSYDDVYRLKAKETTGKPCQPTDSISEDCLQCKCVAGAYACESNPDCRHTDGRRMLHGEYPSDHERNYIDLDKMKEDCVAGMVYKVHCNKCYCQDDRSLRCTQKTCLNFNEIQRLQNARQPELNA